MKAETSLIVGAALVAVTPIAPGTATLSVPFYRFDRQNQPQVSVPSSGRTDQPAGLDIATMIDRRYEAAKRDLDQVLADARVREALRGEVLYDIPTDVPHTADISYPLEILIVRREELPTPPSPGDLLQDV